MKDILVIDDTSELRMIIAAVLRGYGFDVREAGNGEIGIKMIAQKRPDLVVCDINMPGMDGYQTLSCVRESDETATIPFILMTGLVSRDGFRRGMVSGADDYLAKPFAPSELIEAVMTRLARQAAVQMEAVRRSERFFNYAARFRFPELASNLGQASGMAIA